MGYTTLWNLLCQASSPCLVVGFSLVCRIVQTLYRLLSKSQSLLLYSCFSMNVFFFWSIKGFNWSFLWQKPLTPIQSFVTCLCFYLHNLKKLWIFDRLMTMWLKVRQGSNMFFTTDNQGCGKPNHQLIMGDSKWQLFLSSENFMLHVLTYISFPQTLAYSFFSL